MSAVYIKNLNTTESILIVYIIKYAIIVFLKDGFYIY